MPTPREHALTIKGFLQASHAPADLLAGIETVIDALKPSGVTLTVNTQDMPPGSIAELARRFIGKRAAALTEEPQTISDPANSPKNARIIAPAPHGAAVTSSFPAANEAEKEAVAEKKPRKPRAPMSEEHKQKLRDSLAQARAAKAAKNEAVEPPVAKVTSRAVEEEEENPPFKERVQVAQKPGKLMKDVKPNPEWHSAARAHTGYAGKRDDGLLQPGDLVDIRDMIDKHMALEEIALLYNVTVKELDSFLQAHNSVKITKVNPPPFQGAVRRF